MMPYFCHFCNKIIFFLKAYNGHTSNQCFEFAKTSRLKGLEVYSTHNAMKIGSQAYMKLSSFLCCLIDSKASTYQDLIVIHQKSTFVYPVEKKLAKNCFTDNLFSAYCSFSTLLHSVFSYGESLATYFHKWPQERPTFLHKAPNTKS